MAGTELATAWVRLVPSVEGITDQITKEFLPATKQAGEEGDKAGSAWASRLKKSIGVAAVAAGVVTAFKGLYQVGEIFDDVADTIRVGTGASGEALDDLVASAKNVGLKVPAEFEAIGSTIADLNTRYELTGDVLETVASQYLEAGRILGEEVDINKTSAAFSAFRIEGEGVIGAMDTLFQVSQATGVGMNELAAGVQANAPALQNLGFSFEDSISLLGSLDKAGLNATAVMASLSKGLVTLAKDGEQPQEAFERVTAELQGFVDTGDTAAALDLAAQIFGTRGASQFVGALQSGVLSMDDLMAATGATGDTILGVGEETMDFAERWQQTMNTAMVAIEPLASAVFAAVGDGLAAVMPYLQDLGAWVSENTGVIGVIAAVIGGTLVAAMVAWTASIWASTIALLANPVTWIVLAIVALIAAVVALVMNWDQVVEWISEIWSGFIDWIVGVIDGFVAFWQDVWSNISSFFSDIWNNVLTFVQDVWDNIVSFFQTALDWVVDLFLNWTVYGLIIKHWDEIVAFFVSVWENIKTAVSTAINWVKDTINNVTNTVKSVWETVWGAVKNFFVNIWETLVSAGANLFNSVKDKFVAVTDFIASIPDRILGFFAGIGGWLVNSGRALIQGFIDGIMGAFSWAKDKVSQGLGAIRDLFPFSPAKEGPFSGAGWVDKSGKSVGDVFTDSMMDALGRGKQGISGELAGIQSQFDLFDSGFESGFGGHFSIGKTQDFTSSSAHLVSVDGMYSMVPDGAESSFASRSVVVRIGSRDFEGWIDERADGRIAEVLPSRSSVRMSLPV